MTEQVTSSLNQSQSFSKQQDALKFPGGEDALSLSKLQFKAPTFHWEEVDFDSGVVVGSSTAQVLNRLFSETEQQEQAQESWGGVSTTVQEETTLTINARILARLYCEVQVLELRATRLIELLQQGYAILLRNLESTLHLLQTELSTLQRQLAARQENSQATQFGTTLQLRIELVQERLVQVQQLLHWWQAHNLETTSTLGVAVAICHEFTAWLANHGGAYIHSCALWLEQLARVAQSARTQRGNARKECVAAIKVAPQTASTAATVQGEDPVQVHAQSNMLMHGLVSLWTVQQSSLSRMSGQQAALAAPALAGISGGADSQFLALLLWLTSPHVELAVIDHQLSSLSRSWSACVQACQAGWSKLSLHQLPVQVRQVDVGTGNLEAQARLARYQELSRLLLQRKLEQGVSAWSGIPQLYLGHQRDDYLEQYFLHLQHGAHPRTLNMGIAPVRQVRIATTYQGVEVGLAVQQLRPLLDFSKSAITAMLDYLLIAWADDPMNADTRFQRVAYRQLLASNPQLGQGVLASMALAQEQLLQQELQFLPQVVKSGIAAPRSELDLSQVAELGYTALPLASCKSVLARQVLARELLEAQGQLSLGYVQGMQLEVLQNYLQSNSTALQGVHELFNHWLHQLGLPQMAHALAERVVREVVSARPTATPWVGVKTADLSRGGYLWVRSYDQLQLLEDGRLIEQLQARTHPALSKEQLEVTPYLCALTTQATTLVTAQEHLSQVQTQEQAPTPTLTPTPTSTQLGDSTLDTQAQATVALESRIQTTLDPCSAPRELGVLVQHPLASVVTWLLPLRLQQELITHLATQVKLPTTQLQCAVLLSKNPLASAASLASWNLSALELEQTGTCLVSGTAPTDAVARATTHGSGELQAWLRECRIWQGLGYQRYLLCWRAVSNYEAEATAPSVQVTHQLVQEHIFAAEVRGESSVLQQETPPWQPSTDYELQLAQLDYRATGAYSKFLSGHKLHWYYRASLLLPDLNALQGAGCAWLVRCQ